MIATHIILSPITNFLITLSNLKALVPVAQTETPQFDPCGLSRKDLKRINVSRGKSHLFFPLHIFPISRTSKLPFSLIGQKPIVYCTYKPIKKLKCARETFLVLSHILRRLLRVTPANR